MQTIYELLSHLGGWNWVIVALLLLSLETVVPGVHFLWFGLAAFIVGVTTLVVSAAGPEYAEAFVWQFQIIAFALVSMVTVFFVRRYASAGVGDAADAPSLNVRAQQYIGRSTTVMVAIQGGRGKVKIGDSIWQAEGADAPVGARVKVTGVNGSILIVEPV
ncbi:MAG: NfeD family protein [Alphaproteobacteria bacterium]|nr:NfeD family protein [Alphaproteobacteria bacterium]